MRPEKIEISREYSERLNESPFFILVDYQGLKVEHFAELRKRLRQAGSEIHVIKNTIFKAAAQQAGLDDLGTDLRGQLALVTGERDVSGAAKALKNFQREFEKPAFQFGFFDSTRMGAEELSQLADLPSLEELRGQIAGLISTPATRLARVLQTPAQQLAQVLKAKVDKG